MAASSLQDILPQLLRDHDTKKRLQLGIDLLAYLENPECSLECEEPGAFIDGLVSWLHSSHPKISQNGLDALITIAKRMKDGFQPYVSTVLPAATDRLGDSKDQVRAQARNLLLVLISEVSTPQHIFEKLNPSFNHKNFRVREEVMLLLQETLVQHGAQALTVSKLMPHIVKLLGDPNSQVRDTATKTLVEVYKHVGEVVRKDLGKKYPLSTPKLQAILAKFDEAKDAGEVVASTTVDSGHRGDDDIDSKVQIVKTNIKRVGSGLSARRAPFAPSSGSSLASATSRVPTGSALSSTPAGGADEELFIRSFTDVPRIQLYSGRELEQELTKIREILSNNHSDWVKKIDTLKRLRSLLIAGASDYDELSPNLRSMELAFQMAVKDLRSQVVREACITIAFLAQQLGPRLDHFAEAVLPYLINLIQNSAKIMSSAGTVAIRFIIQHTHVSRLIPIITNNLSSKSKDIRKACCEFLDQLLHTWPTHTLEKHVALLQDAIKKGISDADSDARLFSRKAYWGFADHFRDQADSLLNSLDSSKQRMLQGECMSNSSSSNSLNSGAKTFRSSGSIHGGSVENLNRVSGQRSGIPIFSTKTDPTVRSIYGPSRSISAIDMGAARRAKANIRAANRGVFSTANLPRGSGASLPRTVSRKTENVSSAVTSPDRTARSRSKVVSHSQPSSRSGSPSSRLSYATYQMQSTVDGAGGTPGSGRIRRRSGIPTAGGTSRDASPTRNSYDRRQSNTSFHAGRTGPAYTRSSTANFLPSFEAPVPVLSERILPGNKEAEDAVADALGSGWHRLPGRKRYNAYDDQSDESETSSVCSDRSYGSYGGRAIDDVADIIHCLMSVQWKDRKEGLLGLQMLLQANHPLTGLELKKITDIFTRLFMDPHMKVFTLFLDTLHDLIICHKHELRGWLFPLVTRILLKLGSDILPSLHSKIQQTLELIRDSFPHDEQFNAIARFVNDPTQTHNIKVKTALINYLHSLLLSMDAREFSASHPDTKMAISKIISWTADPKGSDLKKPVQDIIVALFKLNTPEFSLLLNQTPKLFQDSAFKLINTQLGRRSSGSTDSSPSLGGGGTLRSPSSPIMSTHSSNTGLTRTRSRSGTPQNSSFEYDDTENLVPEDYYNSLRKTSAEIQKYSQDSLDSDLYLKESCPRNKLGDMLGPASSPQGDRSNKLDDGFSVSSPTKRSTYNPNVFKDQNTRNAFNMQSLNEAVFEAEMDIADDFPVTGNDSRFKTIMTELNNHNVRNEQRKACLQQLLRLAKEATDQEWEEHFREILRLLKDTIGDTDASVRTLALRALCELIVRQHGRFHGYIEMTVLKILEAQKDPDRDVVRAAELCSANAACYLPPEHCIRTLKSIIMTEGYGFPVHQAAIKMITKMVEHHPKNVVMQMLPEMMPALIQAYDHQESCVRKTAVFCLVDIHGVVGEAMTPHLLGLNGSKMKLLSVYIKRSQNQGSSGTGQSGDYTSQSGGRY